MTRLVGAQCNNKAGAPKSTVPLVLSSRLPRGWDQLAMSQITNNRKQATRADSNSIGVKRAKRPLRSGRDQEGGPLSVFCSFIRCGAEGATFEANIETAYAFLLHWADWKSRYRKAE